MFFVSFYIIEIYKPEFFDEFNGFLSGKIRITDCSIENLKNKTVLYKGNIPSLMSYFEFSGHNFTLSKKGVLSHLKNKPLDLVRIKLREPLSNDFIEVLYSELWKQSKKRGGKKEFKQDFVEKLLQSISIDPNTSVSWESFQSQPFWGSLFGIKCDAARLPLIRELRHFFSFEKKQSKDHKLDRKLDKLPYSVLVNFTKKLQTQPWMLCFEKFVATPHKIKELSLQGCLAAIKKFKIPMEHKPHILVAIRLYDCIKQERTRTHSTLFRASQIYQLFCYCSGNQAHKAFWKQALLFLNHKAIVFLNQGDLELFGLISDMNNANRVFDRLNKVVMNDEGTPLARDFQVPCIPKGPFEPEQASAAKHIITNKITVVEGLPGSGKCLGGDTKILMANGTIKSARNIVPGDRLVGDDGSVRIVTSTCTGQSDMFCVYDSDSRLDKELDVGFECNDAHNLVFEASFITPLPQKHLNNKLQCTIETKRAFEMFMSEEQRLLYEQSGKNLQNLPLDKRTVVVGRKWKSFRKDVQIFPDHTDIQSILNTCLVSTMSFPERGTPILSSGDISYYVGAWLGDGKSTTPYSITIAPKLYSGEENVLCKIAQSAGLSIIRYMSPRDSPNGKRVKEFVVLNDKKRKDTPAGRFQYILTTAKQINQRNQSNQNVICKFFEEIGLGQEKYIPDVFFGAPKKDRLCLLAGLIDTDGYLNNDNKYYEIVQKSKRLSLDIVRLSRSLGFRTTINRKVVNDVTYYRMNISGSHLFDIPCQIQIKIATASFPRKKSGTRYGTKIEYIGKGDYYGFQLAMLDKNNNFIHSSSTCDSHADGRYPGRFLLADYTVTHNTELIVWIKSAYENVLVCSFVSMMVQSLRQRLGNRIESAHTLNYVVTKAKHDSKNTKKWLSCYDIVVIDECSNVNIKLLADFFAILTKSIKKFVFLGDLGQIGPIQPAFVFHDIVLWSKKHGCWFKTVTNKRTKGPSRTMANNAMLIDSNRAHEIPFSTLVAGRPFVFLGKKKKNLGAKQQNIESLRYTMKSIYKEILKEQGKNLNLLLHQVLVLKNNGQDGRNVVNQACELALLDLGILSKSDFARGLILRKTNDGKSNFKIFEGKKIIFTKKHKAIWSEDKQTLYSEEVLNGEQGIVTNFWNSKLNGRGVIFMQFRTIEGNIKKVVVHNVLGIDPFFINGGYAVTTNKSQGSEWPYVVYIMLDSPSKWWTREYSYVAVSRSSTCCWVVGDRNVFLSMCKHRAPPRDTILSQLLEKWDIQNQQLVDENREIDDNLKPFNLLRLMDYSKPCSPRPIDHKKKERITRK